MKNIKFFLVGLGLSALFILSSCAPMGVGRVGVEDDLLPYPVGYSDGLYPEGYYYQNSVEYHGDGGVHHPHHNSHKH